jgi:endonuclease YncB( thermonuclease family)
MNEPCLTVLAAKPGGEYPAIVVAIHDGDTLRLDIELSSRCSASPTVDLGFNIELRHNGIWLARQAVRLWGCNAPEIRTTAGQASLYQMRSLVKLGDKVTLTYRGADKYGTRILGSICLQRTPPVDVVTAMIASGHCVPWDGHGPKPVRDCQ